MQYLLLLPIDYVSHKINKIKLKYLYHLYFFAHGLTTKQPKNVIPVCWDDNKVIFNMNFTTINKTHLMREFSKMGKDTRLLWHFINTYRSRKESISFPCICKYFIWQNSQKSFNWKWVTFEIFFTKIWIENKKSTQNNPKCVFSQRQYKMPNGLWVLNIEMSFFQTFSRMQSILAVFSILNRREWINPKHEHHKSKKTLFFAAFISLVRDLFFSFLDLRCGIMIQLNYSFDTTFS